MSPFASLSNKRCIYHSYSLYCSFALTHRPFLPDKHSWRKATEGLWRCKWGHNVAGEGRDGKGTEDPHQEKSPSPTHQKGSLLLFNQRELEWEGNGGKQDQHPPPSHSTNIRIFLCPQLCYYTCTFLC